MADGWVITMKILRAGQTDVLSVDKWVAIVAGHWVDWREWQSVC